MMQSVRERTTELGVLKALGFRNEMVLGLVLAESCLITAIGGLIGLGVSWVMTLGGSPVPQMLPVFYLPGADVVTGVGLVLALGLWRRACCRRFRRCGCRWRWRCGGLRKNFFRDHP